jgi:hypothetical protein
MEPQHENKDSGAVLWQGKNKCSVTELRNGSGSGQKMMRLRFCNAEKTSPEILVDTLAQMIPMLVAAHLSI